MATMGFRYWDGPVVVKEFLEGQTSGSFKAGDLVALSSGELILAANGQDAIGIALKDASGTAGTVIPVILITPETEFLAKASTAATTANIGGVYDLVLTAGSQYVNFGSSTQAPQVVVVGIDPRDSGRVIVRFAYDTCDAIGG